MPTPALAAGRVSIVVTTHNYGRFLGQCLQSALDQTHPDLEVIVVDDGSTDAETPVVLERYGTDPRVTTFRLPGVGLAAASNSGIRRSRGEYILRLDADDFLHPAALAILAEELRRRPDIGLVYPDFYNVDEAGRFLSYSRVPRVQEGEKLFDNNPLAGGALYRRSCYDAIGGYDETLRYQEDFDFWLRFTRRFAAFGVGLPLLSYRRHTASMSQHLAERSAARRYVKRLFASAHKQLGGEQVLVVVPATWPGSFGRDERLLCQPLGGSSLLSVAVSHAVSGQGISGVAVVTDSVEIKGMADSLGAVVVSSPAFAPEPSELPEVTWLRTLLQHWPASDYIVPTVVVLASPFCPLRHPDRIQEAVDTLLIHGCDLVMAVDAEPVRAWALQPDGMRSLQPGVLPSGIRVYRQAGELLAVRRAWLEQSPASGSPVIGHVELLYPEWLCVKDEKSWSICLGLLKEAEAIRVSPGAYLRNVE